METIYKNMSPRSEEEYYEYDGWSESEWDDDETEDEIYETICEGVVGEYLEPVPHKTIELAPKLPILQKRPGFILKLTTQAKQTFRNRRNDVASLKKRIYDLWEKIKRNDPKTLPKLVPMSIITPPRGFVRAQRTCRCANGCVCPSLIIFPSKEKYDRAGIVN